MKLSSTLSCALLAACSYSPSAAIDPGVDAPPLPDIDAPITDPVIPPCSAPDDSGLVLCLELDDGVDDGTLYDSSGGKHHATTSGLAPATRTMPSTSPAALVGTDAVTRIAETAALDRHSAYTFGVWVRPDALPAEGVVYGILDHEQQYAMLIGHSIGGNVENRCVHTGVAQYEWTEGTTAGAWSFLACTWDGTTMCAYRWSATSSEHFCDVPAIKPNTSGVEGLAIGHLSDQGAAHSRFGGALDSLQIYDRGMTEDQLCTLIGRTPGCFQ